MGDTTIIIDGHGTIASIYPFLLVPDDMELYFIANPYTIMTCDSEKLTSDSLKQEANDSENEDKWIKPYSLAFNIILDEIKIYDYYPQPLEDYIAEEGKKINNHDAKTMNIGGKGTGLLSHILKILNEHEASSYKKITFFIIYTIIIF